MTRTTRQTTARWGVALLAALVPVIGAPMVAGAAPGDPPVHVDTFGGPAHAEMHPSGLEVAANGDIVVADTGNNEVARYTAAGAPVWRVGEFGLGTGQFDNPRDIAFDSAGNIYVADTRNSRIVKLEGDGDWITTFSGDYGGRTLNFMLGVSVVDDVVYVGDTGRHRVVVMTTDGTFIREIVANGVCDGMTQLRDATADSAGNVYVTGYKNNTIMKYSSTGTCLLRWGSTGLGNGQFRTPYGVDVAVDPILGIETLYVADGLNSRFQQFDLDGAYLTQAGVFGEPDVDGTVTTMRRVAVAADGDVWAADLWGYRAVRFDRDASPSGYTQVQQIGQPWGPATDTAVFHEPRQVAFDPAGNAYTADTVHHQVVKMDPTGHITQICGGRADEGAELGGFNWPRGVAIDPANGNLWVADTKQNRVQILEPDCDSITFLGDFFQGSTPIAFYWPYGVALRASDRTAWVTDTQNHRVKVYDMDTRQLISTFGQKGTGFSRFTQPAGIAVNPSNGKILVADIGQNRVVELNDTNGTNVSVGRQLKAGSTLLGPEGVAADSFGRIYVADSENDRLVIMDSDGVVLHTVGGFSHPATVAVNGGRIYVSDTYADKVEVYQYDGPAGPDTTPPNGTVAVPTPNQAFPQSSLGPITLSGNATDDRGVATVLVAVKRSSNSTWLKANGTFSSGFVWLPATLGTPGGTSTTWSKTFTPVAYGGYQVQVRTDDAAANTDPTRPVVNFAVTQPDTTPPDSTATTPNGIQVPPGGQYTAQGSATDNVGVASVRIAIRRNDTNQWWRSDGTWGAKQLHLSVLGTPGGVSTTWSYTWNVPANAPVIAQGYGLQVEARDAAGNIEPAPKPWVSFRVQ